MFSLLKCSSYRSVQDLEYVVMKFEAFGKDYIKACKISPDCFVQLALQLTFFKYVSTKASFMFNRNVGQTLHHQFISIPRTHRKLVATYESAAIRRFKHGRVDVIRSASKEAYAWVKSMCGPNNDSVLVLAVPTNQPNKLIRLLRSFSDHREEGTIRQSNKTTNRTHD